MGMTQAPLEIVKYETYSEAEVLGRLKATRLVGHGQPEIYRTASLEMRSVDPEALWPAQRYVLKGNVQVLRELHSYFQKQGIDIFSMRGGVWFSGREETVIPLLPPIVEESYEADDSVIPLINDGIHRVYAARQLGLRSVVVVYIRNVPREYPYYAYPLVQGWNDVEELCSIPDDFKKKAYREVNYKELFRDFNAVFPGVQEKRKSTAKVVDEIEQRS